MDPQDPQDSQDPFETEEQWVAFVRGLAAGDPGAFERFWQLYGGRLDAVARRHFPQGLNRRLAPEDVVQSTCRSFFVRIGDGRLQVSDRDSLWGLLCAIVLNKMRMKQRYHLAQRRSLGREQDLASSSGDDTPPPAAEFAAAGQSVEDAAIFNEQFGKILELLDPTERQILQLKLDNYSSLEISQRVDRSERTVRRVLERLQQKLTAVLPTPGRDRPEE